MQINWNELRDRAYKIAGAHGWYKENLSDEHFLMLVITEVSEAVQADRRGKLADTVGFNCALDNLKNNQESFYKYAYLTCISGSLQDELADIVIRLLSLAGARNIDISYTEDLIEQKYNWSSSFTVFAYEICNSLTYHNDNLLVKIIYTIADVYGWCRQHDIDLSFFIEHKMKYNELREYKHGVSY